VFIFKEKREDKLVRLSERERKRGKRLKEKERKTKSIHER
jgi:hypothetical protein